jgi:hypothetical protein
MMSAKDPGALAKLNAELAQPNAAKWMDYSRSVYELVSEMQKEVTAVMEAQYGSLTKNAEQRRREGQDLRRWVVMFRRHHAIDHDRLDQGVREHDRYGQANVRHGRSKHGSGRQDCRPGQKRNGGRRQESRRNSARLVKNPRTSRAFLRPHAEEFQFLRLFPVDRSNPTAITVARPK